MFDDYQRLHQSIIEAVASDGMLSARMQSVITACDAQYPDSRWELFRAIDFDSETARIDDWMSRAFAGFHCAFEPAGLWFGLVSVADAEGRAVSEMYASVSPDFDASTNEWARGIERPAERNYLDSQVLAQISVLATDDDDSDEGPLDDAEYPLVLAYGAMAARRALERGAPLPPTLRRLRGTAVGFDSGDYLELGTFRNETFVLNLVSG